MLLGLAGCDSKAPSTDKKEPAGDAAAPKKADSTMECDVVVVGLGASGLQAAYWAATGGAKVIAIDSADSMLGTTNTRTSAPWCVGSKTQTVGPKASPEPVTIEEAMNYVNLGTNYQANQKAMRAVFEATGKAIDVLTDAGMPIAADFSTTNKTSPMMPRGGHLYGVAGEERAAFFTKVADEAGVECVFSTTAKSLLLESGAVAGVQCESGDGKLVDIKAKAVCLCSGGFLGSPEETAKYFAGAEIVCMGNQLCKGAGINMALSAGSQMGKCFSISMNEYGGSNLKAPATYSFRPTSGTNEAMRLPVYGGLLVDSTGARFVNEGVLCEKAMFCAEPLVRESYHYAVCDEAFMKRWETEPLPVFLGDDRMKGMFADFKVPDIRDQFAKAVEEGWAFTADTIAELAEHFKLVNLERDVAKYNELCAAGADSQFFKDPKFLAAVAEPPFYIVESMPAGWLSLGGIKCNEDCQAVDAKNQVVPGLFVAGADADLFTSPYYLPGSANGFALGSGLIAGKKAAESLK